AEHLIDVVLRDVRGTPELREAPHHGCGGDLAGRVPAHPVGDGEDRRDRDVAVLIRNASSSDAGQPEPRELDLEVAIRAVGQATPRCILTARGHCFRLRVTRVAYRAAVAADDPGAGAPSSVTSVTGPEL